jgi:hypothetical protein
MTRVFAFTLYPLPFYPVPPSRLLFPLLSSASCLPSRGNNLRLLVSSIHKKLGGPMLALRLYVAVLALVFLLASVLTAGVGMLHGIVLVCGVLYLIIDVRQELHGLRALEARVSSFSTLIDSRC